MKTYYGDDTSQTALFCEIMDIFFGELSVKNKSKDDQKRKNVLKPYRNIDGPRLDWLRDVFKIYQTVKKALKSNRENLH